MFKFSFLNILILYFFSYIACFCLFTADGSLAGTEKPPVVVLIEALTWQRSGANIIDASVLATRGRLMVATVNFRLGVLGQFTIHHHWLLSVIVDTALEHSVDECRLIQRVGQIEA